MTVHSHIDNKQGDKKLVAANQLSRTQGIKQSNDFSDNRPEAMKFQALQDMANTSNQVTQLNAYQQMANNGVLQGKFYLAGAELAVRHLNPVERWVEKFHEEHLEEFKGIRNDEESKVDIDEWLGKNFKESLKTINKSDEHLEDAHGVKREVEEEFGGWDEDPAITLAYGEESTRGALADLRKKPLMAMGPNKYIASTPGGAFPADEEAARVKREFERRGGDTRTSVDVRTPLAALTAGTGMPMPTNAVFRYPRTDRGSDPSTAAITEAFVERVAEAGTGEMSIPKGSTYGAGGAGARVRNQLYGSGKFDKKMKEKELSITAVRPGPEHEEELGDFGYTHRQTDREEERSKLKGKTLVITRGDGPTSMDTGDKPERKDEKKDDGKK